MRFLKRRNILCNFNWNSGNGLKCLERLNVCKFLECLLFCIGSRSSTFASFQIKVKFNSINGKVRMLLVLKGFRTIYV